MRGNRSQRSPKPARQRLDTAPPQDPRLYPAGVLGVSGLQAEDNHRRRVALGGDAVLSRVISVLAIGATGVRPRVHCPAILAPTRRGSSGAAICASTSLSHTVEMAVPGRSVPT